MDDTQNSVAEWLGEKGTSFYLLMMMTVFPLFYSNKMFHLVSDKENIFLRLTFIYICITIPAIVKIVYNWWKSGCTLKLKKTDTVFGIILLLAVITSTIFAIDRRISFFQTEKRTISGFCFLCCIMIYFMIRKYGKYDGIFLWSWLAGSSIIYLFGILCACGIDFMNIQEGIEGWQKYDYLTPLGQMDTNTSYLSLMLPPIVVMYMICKERFSRMIHGINLYMGFLFTFFIKTESSVIAIGSGMIILAYFAVENSIWFKRYIHIVGIYLGSKTTIRILLYLFGNKLHPFNGIGQLLLEEQWIICEWICYLLVCFIWRWKKDLLRQKLLAARKYALACGIVIVLCCGVGTVYVNIRSSDIPADSFLHHLALKDSTFNKRGFIWKRTVWMLKNEGIIHKIFGNGLSCYSRFMSGNNILNGLMYYDPHNEMLQMTSDMGLIGLVGYYGLIISTVIRAMRSWKNNELQIVVIMGLCVYLIQSLVNAYAILYSPLLFIFLGLANGSICGSISQAPAKSKEREEK